MKVKISTNQGDAPKLEKEINQWLLENENIEVKHIKQDYAYDNEQFFYALVSIWYFIL
jgi:hypothetical protein